MPIRKILCLLFFAVMLSSGVEAKKKDKRSIVRIETNAGVMRVALFDDTPLHRDNFYATQFHPEKSGDIGELILKNFIEL